MSAKAKVIICPGGAYRHLSPRESEPVARAFEAMGCEAHILNYRIREAGDAPLGLGPVRELSAKVEEVRACGGDVPVLVCGFSAGGHLAATLGVHWRTLGLSRPDGLILCYPVITSDERFSNAESIENIALDDDQRKLLSLEEHVSPDTPPTFLWHTASDGDVPVENTLLFAQALRRCRIPFEVHIYPFGEHGLSLATKEVEQPEKRRFPDAHVAGWIRECGEWIDQMLPTLKRS